MHCVIFHFLKMAQGSPSEWPDLGLGSSSHQGVQDTLLREPEDLGSRGRVIVRQAEVLGHLLVCKKELLGIFNLHPSVTLILQYIILFLPIPSFNFFFLCPHFFATYFSTSYFLTSHSSLSHTVISTFSSLQTPVVTSYFWNVMVRSKNENTLCNHLNEKINLSV